jgi:hypothetical protein
MLKREKTFQLGLAGIIHLLIIANIAKSEELSVTTNQPVNSGETASSLTQTNQSSLESVSIAQIQLESQASDETDAISQVNNVSQLRDVSPGDWAFEHWLTCRLLFKAHANII